MRQRLTMAPVGLLLVMTLLGAGPPPVASEVTVPDMRFGSRIAPILLLTRPDVQGDLQLNAQQVAAARSEIARLIKQASSPMAKTGPAARVARERIDNAMGEWLKENLSPKQLDRLLQVTLQWEGAAALTRDHVRTHVYLSDPQYLAIKRLVADLEETRRTRGMLAPAEIGRFTTQAQAVLSPDQKRHWDALLGPPCRFSIGGQTVMTHQSKDPRVVKTGARSDQ